MEDAAGAARGASLPMPSSKASTVRKEGRVVSEHSARSAGDEEFDRSKLGHSHERTKFEVQQGQELHDAMNFCSIQMDGNGGLDVDSEQKLQNLAKKREELQNMEIQLRAHMIASSAIVEMKNSFDSQIKEQAEVIAELQEQLDEREQRMMELGSKMEDKERELHAIRLDNEAAWAKKDLLREQNMELANFRRERDNVEAERAHCMKQIHELQEHIQEKDRQAMELQEQHRIAQETVLYKEEQLREAQAWIARVQEMDALQSSTNHSLQAELRERTEQYNQLWLGCQRQFMEMERLHMQTIQQLQLELSEAREKSGIHNDESHVSKEKSNGLPQFGKNNGNLLEANGRGSSSENSANASNGHSESSHSVASSGKSSAQANHVPGVPVAPSLLGVASYLPPGQVTVHPYVMRQQGANHSVPASVSQSYVGHFPTTSAMSSYQHWQGQQAVTDGLQGSLLPSVAENNLARSASNYNYDTSVNGQVLHPDHLNAHSSQGMEASSTISPSEVPDSVDKGILMSQGQATLQEISSQFHETLKLMSVGQTAEIKGNNVIGLTNDILESREMTTEQSDSSQSPPSEKFTSLVSSDETKINNTADGILAEVPVSVGQTNTVAPKGTSGTALLDERSLLACIVRTIPAGGNIRISSSLPNRLGKMLAPLHWHDYKKKYGKLDDFVASHPELFLIEGDYIQLREGAQGIIAATAAVAKVAAAAAATSPYLSLFPSVAVTPMAQANRLKKTPSAELNYVGNGDVKVLSKSKDSLNIIAPSGQPDQSFVSNPRENGSSSDRSCLDNTQGKGKINSRSGANIISKQQGRAVASQIISRR